MYSATVMGPVAVILDTRCLSMDGLGACFSDEELEQLRFSIPVHCAGTYIILLRMMNGKSHTHSIPM